MILENPENSHLTHHLEKVLQGRQREKDMRYIYIQGSEIMVELEGIACDD